MATKTLINHRYELDELPLARGGMGEVWTGRDVRLEREVAVKFIRFPDDQPDQELVRRFVRESRITARLEHPGVPAVYDVGTHDGRPYLVMQRIRGVSVADLPSTRRCRSAGRQRSRRRSAACCRWPTRRRWCTVTSSPAI